MEITNCPQCGDEIRNAGQAFWPGSDEAVAIAECQSDECGWAGVEFELWHTAPLVGAASVA